MRINARNFRDREIQRIKSESNVRIDESCPVITYDQGAPLPEVDDDDEFELPKIRCECGAVVAPMSTYFQDLMQEKQRSRYNLSMRKMTYDEYDEAAQECLAKVREKYGRVSPNAYLRSIDTFMHNLNKCNTKQDIGRLMDKIVEMYSDQTSIIVRAMNKLREVEGELEFTSRDEYIDKMKELSKITFDAYKTDAMQKKLKLCCSVNIQEPLVFRWKIRETQRFIEGEGEYVGNVKIQRASNPRPYNPYTFSIEKYDEWEGKVEPAKSVSVSRKSMPYIKKSESELLSVNPELFPGMPKQDEMLVQMHIKYESGVVKHEERLTVKGIAKTGLPELWSPVITQTYSTS